MTTPFRLLLAAVCLAVALPASAAQSTLSLLIRRPATADRPAEATFQLPQEGVAGATLRLTAHNGDSRRRHTVRVEIDGAGDTLDSAFTATMAEGFVASGATRTWTLDLARPLEASGWEAAAFADAPTVDLLARLRAPGEHRLVCRVEAASAEAPGSWVSAALTVVCGAPARAAARPRAVLQVDAPADPRMKVAVERLSAAIAESTGTEYDYVLGPKAARRAWPRLDTSDLGPEGFVLRTVRRPGRRPCVVAAGATPQGTAYGALRLARIVRTAPDRLPGLRLRLRPAFPVREVYEEHGWCNPAEMWRYRRLLHRYLAEGVNTLDLPIGWFLSPPEYLKGPTAKPREDFATAHAVIAYAHALGIRVYLVEDAYLNPLNGEPKENLKLGDMSKQEQMWALTGGRRDPMLLCLANPASRDLLRCNRQILYREFRDVDGVVVYFGDPGGCEDRGCLPHGKKIVEYLRDIYAPLVRSTNPSLKLIPTLWGVGLPDTEYVLAHVRDLPRCVSALQVPPTSFVSGRYMYFEPRRATIIRQAARTLPVTLQQFWDGVGYHDSWVDIWEHPMPGQMRGNLLRTMDRSRRVSGVYGSAFDMAHQLVDTRLGMAWGWEPRRDPAAILAEMGDEQFGAGAGDAFARAMLTMESYWFAESRRFFFDTANLTDADLAVVRISASQARGLWEALLSVEPRVVRGRAYYRGFEELAELMACAAELNLMRERARRFLDAGRAPEALPLARAAKGRADRMVAIIKGSERYGFLSGHMWWSFWDIGRRPVRLADLVADAERPDAWNPVRMEDLSFDAGLWEHSGLGSLTYVTGGHAGRVAAKLTARSGMAYCELHPRHTLVVRPGGRYRVTFWARPIRGKPRLYVDWFGPSIDGENIEVSFAAGAGWRRYRVDVSAPAITSPTPLTLRFVAYENAQELLLDDVQLWERE